MFKTVMASEALSIWPIVALVVFFGFSLFLLAWVFRPNSRQTYEALSRTLWDGEAGDAPKIQDRANQLRAQRGDSYDERQ